LRLCRCNKYTFPTATKYNLNRVANDVNIRSLTEVIATKNDIPHNLSSPPDDDGSVHLLLDDDSRQDSASDGHIAGEWALLVDVVACTCKQHNVSNMLCSHRHGVTCTAVNGRDPRYYSQKCSPTSL